MCFNTKILNWNFLFHNILQQVSFCALFYKKKNVKNKIHGGKAFIKNKPLRFKTKTLSNSSTSFYNTSN